MKRLKNKPSIVLLFLVSLVGLADASYLTYEHYTGNNVVCSFTGGCEKVLTSQYSTIFGVPIAIGGIIFYLTVLAIAFHYLRHPITKRATQLLLLVTTTGVIVSAVLTSLQAFVIKSWCQFCLLSAFTSLTLFILSVLLWRQTKKMKGEQVDEKS